MLKKVLISFATAVVVLLVAAWHLEPLGGFAVFYVIAGSWVLGPSLLVTFELLRTRFSSDPQVFSKMLLRLFLKREDYELFLADLLDAYDADMEEFSAGYAKFLFVLSVIGIGLSQNKLVKLINAITNRLTGA